MYFNLAALSLAVLAGCAEAWSLLKHVDRYKDA